MPDFIISFPFSEIENLFNQVAKLEWQALKLELDNAKLLADLELLQTLKNCELPNLISVK